MKAKLIPAIGGGKEDPPQLLWEVMLFNALTMAEIENARAFRDAHPDRLATPYDDAEALVRQPSPAAFLGATWTEELHPRERGRFTTKDGDAETEKTEPSLKSVLSPVEKAAALAGFATSENWGDADTEQSGGERWGHTNPELLDTWQDANEASREVVGVDVGEAVTQWSYGYAVEEWRAAYDEWRSTGDVTSPPGEVHRERGIDQFRERIDQLDRGMKESFELIEGSRIDAPLYRGLSMRDDAPELAALKVGDTLPDGMASWSRATDVRDVFRELDSGARPRAELTLEPGAHGLDIATLGAREYAWQEEVIVGGPLTVTSIEKTGSDYAPLYRIGLKAAT